MIRVNFFSSTLKHFSSSLNVTSYEISCIPSIPSSRRFAFARRLRIFMRLLCNKSPFGDKAWCVVIDCYSNKHLNASYEIDYHQSICIFMQESFIRIRHSSSGEKRKVWCNSSSAEPLGIWCVKDSAQPLA